MKTAHSVICYYCYICRTLQYTYKAYTEHVLNVHAPYNINGLYMCFKCIPWRSIDSMTELLNHCRSNHMPTIHICYLCDNKYYFENAFLEHKLTHWQYKERKCEICNEQFSSLNLLTQHIRKSHHDAILCEKCYDARIYQSKTMLKVHDHAEHTDIVIL
ncbi:zinc finger protein 728-like [Pseudomyrmex gracilis]|uniref:zinc finger protein 728-like n=1 Tax=Pseudomyrmex gracilis TaxID=219809 RepID=UPI000994E699|nr:zinc finger protein 728-like [Pseudomyrmex gracilis]